MEEKDITEILPHISREDDLKEGEEKLVREAGEWMVYIYNHSKYAALMAEVVIISDYAVGIARAIKERKQGRLMSFGEWKLEEDKKRLRDTLNTLERRLNEGLSS